jgi:tetratricopeptide (TPR) repeat protein
LSKFTYQLRRVRAVLDTEWSYLAAGAALVALPLAIGAGLWWSPLSPVALDRPAELVANGDVTGAIGAYVELAESWAYEDVRAEAAWRAGRLASLDGRDPQQAVDLLRSYLEQWPTHDNAGEAWASLGTLYERRMGDSLRAAEAWEKAANANSDHADSPRWLLAAGEGFARSGKTTEAHAVLELAAEEPTVAARALIAQGRVLLAEDPAQAYDAYTRASRLPGDADLAGLARLGAVTALERLEDFEGALAEVDAALDDDWSDASLFRRQHRLRATHVR